MKKVLLTVSIVILSLAMMGAMCEGRTAVPEENGGKAAAGNGGGPVVNDDGTVTFSYTPDNGAPQQIFLAGSFNGWNPGDPMYALEDLDGSGVFSVTVPMDPGSYQYKFVIDGAWTQDEANPEEAPDGFGGGNSIVEVK